MAMVFAINQVNDDPMLLPNVTLRYAIHDFCVSERKLIKVALNILGPKFTTTGIDDSGPRALIGTIVEHSVYSFLPEVKRICVTHYDKNITLCCFRVADMAILMEYIGGDSCGG